MATIIEFPTDAARRARSPVTGAPQEGMGTIVILPVVRIERESSSDDRGPREGAAPSRRRRRRRLRRGMGMPDMMVRVRRAAPAVALGLSSALLGACSGGDFGRTRADMRNDDMHKWIGAEATASVGVKPSQFQLTDNERQLRDLAYPLIEPPHSRPAWKAVFGDYQPSASPWRQKVAFDRTAYGRALIDEPHRSHASRYAQLIDDVRDDITRFEPFFASAIRVIDLDRKRDASMHYMTELSPREKADAVARMQENSLIVQWVQICLEQRVSSYRWALERLVLQAPDSIAAEADRLIGELAAQTANPPVAARPLIQRPLTSKG